jgi:hypothetical protein
MTNGIRILNLLFDGATWDVAKPLVDAGKLPALKRLMESGSWGNLLSLIDYNLLSPQLWTSFAAGKTPEKHGVKDFFNTAKAVKTTRIWEIYEREGKPIGLFRYLLTWPPHETRGFIVPDWLGRQPLAHPAELAFVGALDKDLSVSGLVRNFRLALKHGMTISTGWYAVKTFLGEKALRRGHYGSYWRKRILELRIHSEIFAEQARKHRPHYAAFYAALPDAAHHHYWKFYEPELFPDADPADVAEYKDVIPDSYIAIDRAIAGLLELADENTLIVIASDHGGKANVEKVYRWNEIKADVLLDLLGWTEHLLTYKIARKCCLRVRTFPPGTSSVDEMIAHVLKIRFKEAGTEFLKIWRTGDEEIDIRVRPCDELDTETHVVFPDGREIEVSSFMRPSPKISGTHGDYGWFVLSGPGVRRGVRVEGAGLMDITPTVLALDGRPVGRDMDGKVIEDAIEPEFLKAHPIREIATYDTAEFLASLAAADDTEEGIEDLKKRLEALGYM